MHGLLIAALTASAFADRPWQRRRLLHLPCGALAAVLEQMARPGADTDGNGRVCVGGLGPCALLPMAQPEHPSGLLLLCADCRHCMHHGIAAALVLMQAAQLLPGQTRNVPEPTAGPTAAAVSCMHHMQAGADDVTRLAID